MDIEILSQKFCNYSLTIRGYSKDTIRRYLYVIRCYCRFAGVKEISEVSDDNVRTLFYYGRTERKWSVNTFIVYHKTLLVFFRWCIKEGYLVKNPITDIEVPKMEKRLPPKLTKQVTLRLLEIVYNYPYDYTFLRYRNHAIFPPRVSYDDYRRLDDDQIHKIYSAITLHSTNSLILRRDTLMVSLLVYCGIRKGEFISLQVRDIDMEKQQITIRGVTSKSKKTRFLKMHPTLILHMKDYLRERKTLKTEHLIVSTVGDRGLSREGLKHWVQSLIKKSGVRFHLHQFRHTFACKLAENNVNLSKIQKLLGHSDPNMTAKYTRSLKTEDMAEDIGKISF